MKVRMYSMLATLGMFATFCLHTTTAEAVFASVKSTGMGGTAYSYPLDTLSAAYNPAGLPDVGDRVDAEVAWVRDSGTSTLSQDFTTPPFPPGFPEHYEKSYNGMRTTSVFPVNFGINKNWQIGCSDWTVSTGLIIYNRAYQKTTYKDIILAAVPITPFTPATPLLGTTKPGLEYLSETVSAVFGVQWCKAHTLSISVDYQVERLKVNGLENFIPLSIHPDQLTNKGYDYATGWGLTVGYLGHWTDKLSVGVAYSPEVTMTKMGKYTGFLVQGRLNVPRRIGAGISYKILPCLVVAFDAEQLQWSKVRSLHNPLLQPGNVLEPLGTKFGPGFGFRDQWYYRVGLEWTINECFVARIGFRHANTPIRSSQNAVNMLTLDCVENFITAGGTWNITESQEINIVGAYGFENSIYGKDAIPKVVHFDGTPILLQFGGGNVKLKEEKFAIGLSWGYKY